MITVLENIRRVGDTHRQPSDHTATRRRYPGVASHDVNPPTRLPDQFASSVFISIASSVSSDRAQRPASATERAPLSPSPLAAAKTRTTTRPKLRCVLLFLIALLVEPDVP